MTKALPRRWMQVEDLQSPLYIQDDLVHVQYRDESQLRDALARYAWLAGWNVDTEHHLPGWGRPDLYLTAPESDNFAVELKINLTSSAAVRRAFQQAEMYRTALTDRPLTTVLLVAMEFDETLIRQYDRRFIHVEFCDLYLFMYRLQTEEGTESRHRIALHRHSQLLSEMQVSTHVLGRMASDNYSPLRPRIVTADFEDLRRARRDDRRRAVESHVAWERFMATFP